MGLEQIVANDKFVVLLEWALALEKRYKNLLQGGLIQIQYNSKEVMDSSFGAMDAVSRLDEVMVCLQQCFRDTDAIARYGTTFWVLVPMTDADPVTSKVQGVINTAKMGGLDIEHTDVQVHMLRDHSGWLSRMGCDPQLFLSYLAALA